MRTGGEQHAHAGQARVPDARGGGRRWPDEHGRARAPRAQGRARGNRRPTGGSRTGRCGAYRDQRGVEVLALPAGFSYVTFSHTGSRMSDGYPTPLALDGMGSFAGGRRHGHGHGTGRHLVRLVRNSEDRNPAGTVGGLIGDRSKAYDPTALRRHDDARLRRAAARAGAGLRQPQRHDRQLRGRHLLPPPLLADRRGDRRRAGRRGPAARFDKRHGYLFQTPVDRGPNELEVGVPIRAAGRFSHEAAAVDQRTGIVYETEDPGSGVGAGFYRYTPRRPGRPRATAACSTCSRSPASRTSTCARASTRGRAAAGAVGAHRRARPRAHGRRRPAQHVQPGLGEGRREVQPPRGLLGGRQHDLLRLHQRRRRQERRRQLRRLRGGLRPGLGLPPGRGGGGTLTLVYESPVGASWTRRTTSP